MVEDEEQILNTNCRMLRRRGYDVRTAQTAAEAYHQIDENLPDLLILDEPASGLDPSIRVEYTAIRKELRDQGKTLLVSSHILSEV